MIKKIINLYEKSGLILLLIRLPRRVINVFFQKVSTLYWVFFLKDVGEGVVIEFGTSFENPKNVSIGSNVYIGKGCSFGSEHLDGILKIANGVQISRGCQIDHTGKLIIERNCLISQGVTIFTHSHGYNPKSEAKKRTITIKENCWIGFKCTILENTALIESNTIIASNSVVTKPCDEKNSIYAGSPAKFIRKK